MITRFGSLFQKQTAWQWQNLEYFVRSHPLFFVTINLKTHNGEIFYKQDLGELVIQSGRR